MIFIKYIIYCAFSPNLFKRFAMLITRRNLIIFHDKNWGKSVFNMPDTLPVSKLMFLMLVHAFWCFKTIRRMLFIHTNMGFWSSETALGFGTLSASGGYFFESRFFNKHFCQNWFFKSEIDHSDTGKRSGMVFFFFPDLKSWKKDTKSSSLKHFKSFIEFRSVSAIWIKASAFCETTDPPVGSLYGWVGCMVVHALKQVIY